MTSDKKITKRFIQMLQNKDKTGRVDVLRYIFDVLGIKKADLFPEIKQEKAKPTKMAPTTLPAEPLAGYPKGFELCRNPAYSIPYAKFQGKAIGAVFCVNGKHFIFDFEDTARNTSLNKALQSIKNQRQTELGKAIIPTISMFQEVQKHVCEFNNLTKDFNGNPIVPQQKYLDSSMSIHTETGILRLAIWAPWLD